MRAVLDEGARCCLGTDIFGGYSPSIFENARQAVLPARMLESGVDPALPPGKRGVPGARVGFTEAFWLATRGGAAETGRFSPGLLFDALEIRGTGPLWRFAESDSGADLAQKIVCHAGADAIARVWVEGRLVAGRVP